MNKLLKKIFNKNLYSAEVLNIFTDPVIIFNTGGIIVEANKAVLEALNLKSSELNNIKLTEKIIAGLTAANPDDGKSILSKALKGEIVRNIACQFRDNSGKDRFCTCSVAPIRCRNSITGVVLNCHDITDGKVKEQFLEVLIGNLKNTIDEINEKQKALNIQIKNDKTEIDMKNSQIMITNRLLEIIFSNTHFLIAYLDTDFTFIQVNDAYANTFSRTPDFFTGKNHFDIFPHEKNRAVFEQVVKTGISHITYAEPFFHSGKPGPGINYWDWSLQPVINNHEVEGIILVLIDVTRRKKAEDDLFNAKRLSDIGILAATVAHELRNPLGVIQAALYNIKRKNRNGEIERHLENIGLKIQESEQIINNLLSYSSLKIPKLVETPVYQFLNELFDDIRNKNNDKVTFNRNYEILKDTIANIDSFQIREVLNNIVNNACQSLPPAGGCIEIRGSIPDNRQWQLYIEDNGDGIDNEDLERIFNPFFTKRSKGTGLGLTISRELIKLHNGNIEIQSRKGEGTTVIISLPLKKN